MTRLSREKIDDLRRRIKRGFHIPDDDVDTLCDGALRDVTLGTSEPVAPYVFDRYVNGALMAEGIQINHAENLQHAAAKAARLCPESRGTVLVYLPAHPAGTVSEERIQRIAYQCDLDIVGRPLNRTPIEIIKDAIRTALSESSGYREGVLVPREPTMAMMVAGTEARLRYVMSPGSGMVAEPHEESAECFKAMIAAAEVGDKPQPVCEERLISKLKNVLHRISLGSQNSMTSKEDLGREARAALKEIGDVS